jgi:Skp family chaperone for outer membrane proteins
MLGSVKCISIRRIKLKKATVITICFIFFLCSTFSFCYAMSSQAPGNSLKGTLIADHKDKEEKIEKLEEKIKQLKEDKAKIEKEIQENEKELRHLKKKKS